MFSRAKILYIDAPRFHRALMAGIGYVLSRQDYLNKINVFPVPDGDTGTNMALTLNAIIEKTSISEYDSIQELMSDAAEATLMSARGNSGAILAQFFQGMHEATLAENKINAEHFANMISNGNKLAFEAINEPVKGTILTVIEAFAQHLEHRIKKGDKDFVHLLHSGLNHAETALQNTTKQLAALKRANVVDAGAQGFVDLLTGIYQFIKQGNIRSLYERIRPSHDKNQTNFHDYHDLENLTYRYCTECLINGQNISRNEIRNRLAKVGDSLIVAGSKSKVKIHIHCDQPADIFEICREYGNVHGEKADDMKRQSQTAKQTHNRVAVLVDSSADLPEDMMEKLDIHFTPITIHFGQETYIDKITLKPKYFYKKLKESSVPSTTSQPTLEALKRQFQYLNSHYDGVIALHIPESLSGTYQSSCKAGNIVNPNKIRIIDCKNVAISSGLVAKKVAESALKGLNIDELEKIAHQVIENTNLYAAFPDLSYAVRGGRISRAKGIICNLLRLTPIITFSGNGKVKTAGVIFGKKNLSKRLPRFIKKQLQKNKKYNLAVGYGEDHRAGETTLNNLERIVGEHAESIYLCSISSALGAHTGPEVLGIAVQAVD